MKKSMKIGALIAAVVMVSSLISVTPVAAPRGVRYQLVDYYTTTLGPVGCYNLGGVIDGTVRFASYNYPTTGADRFKLTCRGTCSKRGMVIEMWYVGSSTGEPGGWEWNVLRAVNIQNPQNYKMFTAEPGDYVIEFLVYPVFPDRVGGDLKDGYYRWGCQIGDGGLAWALVEASVECV